MANFVLNSMLKVIATTGTTSVLGDVITTDLMNGVTTEMVSILPAVFPALITALGIRKAISFAIGLLHSM